jgi:hypothetical protein
MSKLDEQTVLRMPQGTAERAEKLVLMMSEDPKFIGMGKVSRSTILRLALLDGLEQFEKKYQK